MRTPWWCLLPIMGQWKLKNDHGGCAFPLRGYKGMTYEGGMRVPMITRWPGKIPEGTVCSEIASTIDMLPTIAYLTGSHIPSDRIIDGKNIWTLMSGNEGAKTLHNEFYYYKNTTLEAVRSGKWKLRCKDEVELYNLETDISESNNLAGNHPEIVERLTKTMMEFDKNLKLHARPTGIGKRKEN